MMEQVYYKGERFAAKRVIIGGTQLYSLFNTEGTLVHFVSKDQLERKSLLNLCIETYLRLVEHA
jgi:hypothetical protein